MNRIEEWAKATQAHEGYFKPGENPSYPQGTAAWFNNNPGNLRASSYTLSLGAHHDKGARGNFVFYTAYDIGFAALKQFLVDAATDVLRPYRNKASSVHKKSARNLTLEEFYSVYAPQSDGNNPNRYAADIARRLNVPVNTEVGSLIEEKPPTPPVVPVGNVKPGQVISRRQGDPNWGSVFLGDSNATLARYGCTVTALSDALYWMGFDVRPDQLAKSLKFTPDGKLYWQSITEKTGAKFVWRGFTWNKSEVAAALKHPKQCVLMEVPLAGAKHWLFVTGNSLPGYKVADPLRGDFANSYWRYGNPTGYTIVEKK